MRMGSRFAAMLALACLWLSGCASAPQLGQADTRGFNAGGATVLVDYAAPKDGQATDQQMAELGNQRREEIHQLLKGHGFRPVASGQATYRIRVTESAPQDVTSEWAGAVGANLVLFTLGVVPAMYDYRSDFNYELWSGDKRLHAIASPATWKEAVGLVSLASTLTGSEVGRQKARFGVHDSVIRLWIDQGSFDQ